MSRSPDIDPLAEFVRSAPAPQRVGMRALIALGRRPRGRALLARSGAANQLAQMLVSLARYDDPALTRSLGWDAEAVVARGRALRRAEGRP
ncbi:MAG TPA: hypothetical protein VGY30_05175 [Solirubrobacteraceae bacterium]|jgi:hypothetical protein|nr:hypothetical protein [Solirubrobacteraceae bacterium]